MGKKIAKTLCGGEVLALTGDLGAGKTTLIKGIAQGLGIKKIITSPTFVLMKIYSINKAQRTIHKLVHLDCYRLKSAQDILNIGAQEYFGRPDTVVVIEWAEKIKPILPKNAIKLKLGLGKKSNERKIQIKK